MPVDQQTESFPGDLPDFGPTSTAPPLEQNAPVGAQQGTEGTIEAETKPKLPEFSAQHRLPLEGLLYLGRLEKRFEWAGHRFHIKTLSSDDRLMVGMLCKPYMGTTEETRAWLIAQVALCVISVDGKTPYTPLGEDDLMSGEAAFMWARKQYPWTIDAIIAHLLDLEGEAEQVLEAMGKASGSEG